MPMGITGTIVGFKENMAIVKTANNKELLWPKSDLPVNISQGDLVTLTLSTKDETVNGQESSVKKMINDLLNVRPQDPD